MKFLLVFLLAFLPACCSNSPQLEYMNDFHTYSLKWDRCPALSTNTQRAYDIFYMACMHGGFDITDIIEEAETEHTHQYLMSNIHGYARMQIDDIQYTCMIQWGGDDFLDFTDFIDFFVNNLVALEQL